MSYHPAQPLSGDYSSAESYKINHENIGINNSEEIKAHDEQVIDVMSMFKTMNTLLKNQEVLVKTFNILFQNQEIIMRKNAEINEVVRKLSNSIVSSNISKEEEIHDRMRRPSTSTVSSDSCEDEESDLPKMPFTNASEFLSFDNELRKNKILRKKFEKKISVIGGSSLQKAVRLIIKLLMTDELIFKKFTWTGIKNTIPMSNKKLPEIIFAVLHRKPSYSNCTLKEVENVVKMWVQQARTRLRAEDRRQAQKALQYDRKPLQEKELLDYYLKDLNCSK